LPDTTVFLTLSPAVAATRGAYGEERYENVDTQTRVRAQFDLVGREVRRRHGDGKWVEVSAEGTLDEVESAIWEAVKGGPASEVVGKLWL